MLHEQIKPPMLHKKSPANLEGTEKVPLEAS